MSRAEGLQQELVQQRTSLEQELSETQALQGKEALLASINEEEMACWNQVFVLSQLHQWKAEEIKSQSDEIVLSHNSAGKKAGYPGESPGTAE